MFSRVNCIRNREKLEAVKQFSNKQKVRIKQKEISHRQKEECRNEDAKIAHFF